MQRFHALQRRTMDLAVHLNLIAATTNVIFSRSRDGPLLDALGNWNNELQATPLTSIIGEANYDIGHMFRASGGEAGTRAASAACASTDRRDAASPRRPMPSPWATTLRHRRLRGPRRSGLQMGSNHSFSFSSEGPGPAQKEVGSGITVMGYAGITNQDVAPHSIDTFHETNIAQVQANMAIKTCPITTVMTANHPPVVAPVASVTVPIAPRSSSPAPRPDPDGDTLDLSVGGERQPGRGRHRQQQRRVPTQGGRSQLVVIPSHVVRDQDLPEVADAPGGPAGLASVAGRRCDRDHP